MIRITINKKRFKGVYKWSDISLKNYCDLAAISPPEGYEAFILADGKYDLMDKETVRQYTEVALSITDEQLAAFPDYYRKVTACLTNIPEKIINKLPDDKICEMYDYYFKPFVLSLIYQIPVIHFMGQIKQYQPESGKYFRLGLRKYYLPKTLCVDNQEYPLGEEPILSYSEVSDLFTGMKIGRNEVNRLAMFMAIYCRKKNEEYEKVNVLERKEIMMDVHMSTVWAVFFCTLRRLRNSSVLTLSFGSLPKQVRESVAAVRVYKGSVQGV